MEQLSSFNKLLFIEWGTYIFISALFVLFIFLSQKKSPRIKGLESLKNSLWPKELTNLEFMTPLLIIYIVALFVLMMLYRNERAPTLELVLPGLLLIIPVLVVMLIVSSKEKKREDK